MFTLLLFTLLSGATKTILVTAPEIARGGGDFLVTKLIYALRLMPQDNKAPEIAMRMSQLPEISVYV